jgi:hypothetical protein
MADDYQRIYAALVATQGSRDQESVVELGADLEFADASTRLAKPSLAIDRLVQEAVDEADFT